MLLCFANLTTQVFILLFQRLQTTHYVYKTVKSGLAQLLDAIQLLTETLVLVIKLVLFLDQTNVSLDVQLVFFWLVQEFFEKLLSPCVIAGSTFFHFY